MPFKTQLAPTDCTLVGCGEEWTTPGPHHLLGNVGGGGGGGGGGEMMTRGGCFHVVERRSPRA